MRSHQGCRDTLLAAIAVQPSCGMDTDAGGQHERLGSWCGMGEHRRGRDDDGGGCAACAAALLVYCIVVGAAISAAALVDPFSWMPSIGEVWADCSDDYGTDADECDLATLFPGFWMHVAVNLVWAAAALTGVLTSLVRRFRSPRGTSDPLRRRGGSRALRRRAAHAGALRRSDIRRRGGPDRGGSAMTDAELERRERRRRQALGGLLLIAVPLCVALPGALTGDPGATVGGVVRGFVLLALVIAVWPTPWGAAERRHRRLEARWRS
jgi:hypothetical protein